MKRLLALLAGGLGLRALLRRRSHPALSPSPADDLRSRLAEARSAGPASEPVAVAAPPVEAEPAQSDVAARRADVHERARAAIDELREPGETT